ncbi:MAG: hypothetical protein M3Q95_11875 [Bacteroidota bacterium]|nr:hypothetical protein [Bacteroidota bacterium]
MALLLLKKNSIPLLIAFILCLELIIYLWAVWTTEADFVFAKSTRNSGRASSAINLIILLMIGYYGLKEIYLDDKKKDTFRILITLFALNHFIHLFFLIQNFKSYALELNLSENKHGFVTFIFILIIPIILWTFKNLNRVLYAGLTLHLFNVSYFIMETLYHKITPDKPSYHSQLGIAVTIFALHYILYRFFRENKLSAPPNVSDGV